MDTYEKLYREFHWETPQHFNFGATIDSFASDPNRVALLWEDQDGNRARLTFADISAQSNRIANVLVGLGIKRGDPVMIVLPRIALWQAAYIGALKMGAIVIPCVSMLREKDLVYRANHSGARAIIAGTDTADLVADLRGACPSITRYLLAGSERTGWACLQEAMQQASSSFKPEQTRGDEPAICYYTSGTTKDPKAVLHGHAYTWAHRYTGLNWLDLKPGDMHWTTSDTGWAKAAYGVLFGPWMNGITTFMYNGRFEPKKELELLERYRITTFCAPPTEFRMLVKEDLARHKLPALRHCTAAGEPLNPEVINVWNDHYKLMIHDGYGQTETTLCAANLPGMKIKPGSMGRPFLGLDVRILDSETLTECAEGDVGQIAVRVNPHKPPSVMLEYWKNPDENAEVFRGDWYLTGDQAWRDSDGYLWFEAFVKLKVGIARSDALADELRDHCKRVTAPYKYPREIEFVDDLPKTISGKIRRVELRKLEEDRKRSHS